MTLSRKLTLGFFASLFILAACGDDDATPSTPTTTTPSADAGSEASNDAGQTSPPQSGGLTTGEGFSIVYSSNPDIGVDARPNAKATFDAAGHLTGYEASADEKLAIGSATDPSAGGDTLTAWGAWKGGPTTGVFYNTKPAGDFTFAEGFHYAIGKQTLATALPSGVVSYTLVGGSTPTIDGASDTGKLDGLTASCDFGPKTCTFTITASAGSATYSETTTAGTLNVGPAGSGQIRVGSVIAVFLGGAGERIGLIWGDKMSDGRTIRGAAVLKH